MSSIYQRGKKGFWHYVSNDGQSRSTKTADEKMARMLQNRWDKQALYSSSGMVNPDMTWGEFREEYFALYGTNAESSFIKLKIAVKNFERIVNVGDLTKMISILPARCEFWQAKRATEISPRSVGAEQKYLSPMLHKAFQRGYTERDAFGDMKPLRFATTEKHKLIPDEVQTFLDKLAKQFPQHAFAGRFFYELGMRVREGVHQRIEDVNFQRGMLKVANHAKACICHQCGSQGKGWTTKNKRERCIPISPALQMELLARFQTQKTDVIFPVKENAIGRAFKNVLDSMGIKKARTHIFRHAFIDDLRRAGVDEKTIKVLAGHSDSSVTEGYMHVDDGELHAAMEKLWQWRKEQITKLNRAPQTFGGFQVITAA